MCMSVIFRKLKSAIDLHFNPIKTLYFNLRVFRFKDALKFPVLIFGNVDFEGIHKGCVSFSRIRRGALKFGGGWHTDMFGYSYRHKSFLRIKGIFECGEGVIVSQGAVFSIDKDAVLKIGNNVRFNERVTLHTKLRIDIGDNSRVGWNSQLIDTNFHYMINNGKLSYRHTPVFIDHNVWIANNVYIMKGAYLPAYSVVAANSLVNKNFSDKGEHCMYGGIPAKLITEGVERLLINEELIDCFFSAPNEVLEWKDVKDSIR